MAGETSDSKVRAAVEQQSGACRGLAMALRAEAKSKGIFHGSEARLIVSWAESIEAIADALIEAIADRDVRRLKRMWKTARIVALPIAAIGMAATTGMGEGAGSAAFDYFTSDSKAVSCAAAVVSHADASSELIADADLSGGREREDDAYVSQELRHALHEYRIKMSWSRYQFAEILGLPESVITRWETTSYTDISHDELDAIRGLLEGPGSSTKDLGVPQAFTDVVSALEKFDDLQNRNH